jgi:hypothetical protein
MGIDNGTENNPECTEVSNTPKEGKFRFRVVEHLSWDNYIEGAERFPFGDKDNKPIAGKKFAIKKPDGSIINETTDADGMIEIPAPDADTKYEIIFEPENARMNNVYYLFYNKYPIEKLL